MARIIAGTRHRYGDTIPFGKTFILLQLSEKLISPSRWVDIAPVAPPPITPIIKGEPEPLVTPRGMVMVIITIILTITIFELLFGGIRWAGPILARLQDARPGQDATADVDAHQV